MAAASAAAIRLIIFPYNHLTAVNPKTNTPNPSRIANFILKTLQIRTLSNHRRRLHSSTTSASTSAAAAYTESEDEGYREEEEDPSGPRRQPPPAPDEAGRLYVGNLPYSMTSSQLAELFAEAGRVESVEIVYDRVTDRSRGFAFVSMGSHEDALAAIRLFDGSQVGGRTVKVNFPEVPRGGEREVLVGLRARAASRGYVDSPHKVYAGNLGWAVTSQSLRDAFASQPGLLGAKIIYDRDSGRSRGFGFIAFASEEDAQAAVDSMNGAELEGRPLRLSPAQQRPSTAASQDSDDGERQLSAGYLQLSLVEDGGINA